MSDLDLHELVGQFFEEADEHLAAMETSLLALEATPGDRAHLDTVFRAAHSIKGGCGAFGFTDVLRFTHALESLLQRLREGALELAPEIADLLLRSKDALADLVAAARSGGSPPATLGELLEEIAWATPAATSDAEVDPAYQAALAAGGCIFSDPAPAPIAAEGSSDPLVPIAPVEARTSPPPSREAPHAAPERVASPQAPMPPSAGDAKPEHAGTAPHTTVRVDTDKIDKLMNLVGELVIAHSMVTSAMNDTAPDALERMREAVNAIGRNTRELQDRVMEVRMVAVGTVLNRFPRMVRDIATRLDKRIDLVIEGQETELDKALVEKLVDPLTHLIRNAVDHGIESPADRIAAGKPEAGKVIIRAQHQGGSVVVEVRDDGRGLQTARIREKAIASGLLASDAQPTDEELHALIFAPGFSTAKEVSDISGRGVGMDVVKRNVEALNGTLHFTSEPGRGSCMRVRLPLTMAIIDGLSVRVGDQVFVVPLTSVVESFRPSREQVHAIFGHGEVVCARGQSLPLVRPNEILGVAADATDAWRGIACILDAGTTRVGLLVDELVGQVQAVVKTVETNFRRVDGVMGATILGDGSVALILDVSAVARKAAAVGMGKEKDHGLVDNVA